MVSIDLNADLGEHPTANLDKQIMPFISSCNIACGGHTGDETSVRQTIILAREQDVAVGAHPSYPDQKNFGRKIMEIPPSQLAESLSEQIRLVQRICKEEEVTLRHVKPHGALYNHAASDPFISTLLLTVIKEVDPAIKWMGLAHSQSEQIAQENRHPFISEGFADRQYEPDGSLRLRGKEGAVLNPKDILLQAEELVLYHRVNTGDDWRQINIQSICLHGDTQGAVTLAKQINHHFVSKGIRIIAV